MTETERCDNCKYSRRHTFNDKILVCRRNPPSNKFPRWPEVEETEWCGEWANPASGKL